MGADIYRKIGTDVDIWKWRAPLSSIILSSTVVGFSAVVLVTVCLVLAPSFHAGNLAWSDVVHPWWYSFKIAAITCLICGILAPFFAWAFRHLDIRERFIDPLMALPYCLPTVAVGGMLVLGYGNAGLLNRTLLEHLKYLDTPLRILYQEASPLLGTIWMNLSLGVMLLIRHWNAIPDAQWHQAELMNFTHLMRFRYIVMPALMRAFLPWLGAVFLSCFNSFGLMLVLSGSPSATTIELATWQSLFVEADWNKAALLMVVQLLSSIVFIRILWSALGVSNNLQAPGAPETPDAIHKRQGTSFQTSLAIFAVTLFAGFYLFPVVALITDVFQYLRSAEQPPLENIVISMTISTVNAVMTGLLTTIIVVVTVPALQKSVGFERQNLSRWYRSVLWLPAVIPGMVCSFAMLVLTSQFNVSEFKNPSIWFIQAFLAVPIAGIIYWNGWMTNLSDHFRVKETLGLSTLTLWSRVESPLMWRWAVTSGVIAAGLSISDVTIVSFLADSEQQPLTLLITRLMGSYRFGEASVIILILVMLSAFLFLLSASRVRRSHV